MRDDLFGGATAKVHRLFFALLPDEAGRSEVAACVATLRTAFPAARWVRSQRWHLTTHYLGESAGRRDDWIARAVEAAACVQAAGFTQRFDELRALGSPRNSALAVAAEMPSPGMAEFWSALRQRLQYAGFHLPGRLLPHLTVAYVPPKPALPVIEPVELRFDAFHLLHSIEGQAEYEVLGSWRLL